MTVEREHQCLREIAVPSVRTRVLDAHRPTRVAGPEPTQLFAQLGVIWEVEGLGSQTGVQLLEGLDA